MKIKYSFICEAANISNSGNLNVLGIFENLNAPNFPVKIPMMFYVVHIEFHRSEIGQHIFKVNFIDSDGKSIIPQLEGQIAVNEGSLSSNIIIALEGIMLNVPDTYAIDLTVDNNHLATDTLNVRVG